MKKLLVCVLTLMMVGLFMGCDDTETVSTADNSTTNNEFTKTMTLQGTLYDATNGARLTGSSLSITMTRGATNYSPSVLKNGASETTFAGDYAFTGVPITLNNEVQFRIIATMDGYQTFEAFIEPEVDELPISGDNNNTIDTVYNKVGNIYMFPLGETAEAINIYVEYNNERIAGATVQLQQLANNNNETSETNNTLFSAVNGALPDLITTTDANGLATFAGSGLVLGGRYDVIVLPIVYEGVQLALNETVSAIDVGSDIATRVVTMADTVPGAEDNGLYIVYASNRDQEDILSTGVLTLVFNKPVGIVSEDAFTASLTNDTTAVLNAIDTCVAAVSADGLTLTLTPQFTTAVETYSGANGTAGTNTADRNLIITYAGGQVYLLGDNQGEALNILVDDIDNDNDGVQYLNSDDVGRSVKMTPPVND